MARDFDSKLRIAESCYSKCGEMVKVEPPAAEDILVFADAAGLCQRIIDKACTNLIFVFFFNISKYVCSSC